MALFLSPAHIGIDKTLERFKNRLFWPGIKECGKDYFKSCSLLSQKTIQKTKQSNTKKLHFWNFWANRDWHFWTPTNHKHWSLIWNINVFDCFTKWTEAIPIPDQTLQLLLQKFFVNNYISHSWCPLQIRGINFKSKVFQDTCLCEPFQIDLTKLTKNYSPSTTIRWEHWMIPENTCIYVNYIFVKKTKVDGMIICPWLWYMLLIGSRFMQAPITFWMKLLWVGKRWCRCKRLSDN